MHNEIPLRQKRQAEEYQEKIARLYKDLLINNSTNCCGKNNMLAKVATFQVTDRCNLACTYCYQINKNTRRMSFETAKQFVDLLLSGEKGFKDYIDAENTPAIVLEFIGGEPFLELELIEKTLDYFMSECIRLNHPWLTRHRISICSNGVLVNKPEVQNFLEKYKKRLSFSITLDGNKELHDSCRVFPDGSPSYDIAFKATEDWRNKGNYMGSKLTLAPENVQYTFTAIKNMLDLGYDDIHVNCAYEEGWLPVHATELYWQLKHLANYLIENDLVDSKYIAMFEEIYFKPMQYGDDKNWCGGDGMMIACDPDGYIYPCLRFMESSLGTDVPPFRIGDIHNGIGQCKEHCDNLNCLSCVSRRRQSTDECYYCPIGQGCSWCTAYNYQKTGSPNKRVTYICEMHKARALANAYLWSRWYAKHYPDYKYPVYIPKEWAMKIISLDEFNSIIDFDNIDYREPNKEGNIYVYKNH